MRADAVHLELLENGTTPTAYLKISHPNTGSFEWAVPAEIEQTTYAIRITNAADTSDFVTSPQFAIFQTPAPSPVSTEAILAAASAVPATWDMLNEAVYAIGAFVVEEGFGAWIYRIQKADRAFNGGDGAHVTTGQFFFVGFAIADMMSDLTFGINAYRTEGTSTIGAAALGWLAFICLVNLCLYCTSTSKTRAWLDRDHEKKNRLTYTLLDLLTITNIELLSLQPWHKGVPLDDGIPIEVARWVTYAGYLEDIPQLILQVAFIIQHRRAEDYVILAFIATVFCLAFRCLYKSKSADPDAADQAQGQSQSRV